MRHSEAPNQSLSKGLAILQELGRTKRDMGVRELARVLELAPSVVQRLVSTLRAAGFLEQNPSTLRYRLGHRNYEIGQSYLAQETISSTAFGELRDLAHANAMSAFLGVMRGKSVIYLLSLPAGALIVNTQPGSRTYLHTTALGKMLLTSLSTPDLSSFVDDLDMPQLTGTTITSSSKLIAEVEKARADGFAISEEENVPGLYSVGAGIHDHSKTVAAISLSASYAIVDEEKKMKMRESVVAVAQRLSRQMSAVGGHRGAA